MLSKASGERARIEALIAREEARVRRAFRRFLDEVRSDAVRRQVRIALEQEGIEAASRVIDAHVVRLSGAINTVFQAAATSEVAALAPRVAAQAARVAIAFDPGFPRAAALMRQTRLAFVAEISRSQRESLRGALAEALQAGTGTQQTARAIRESLGLTETQRRAVANYRRLLEIGDAAALARDIRDRRFDASVRRAVESGEPLGAKQIARMVDRYRARYLQYRAESVARTETIRTVGRARREAMAQTIEQAEIPRGSVRRTWASTRDKRVRDTHDAMDGQQVRGFDTPFVSPSGARLMFPGDESLGAPASEVINCRCAELYEFD